MNDQAALLSLRKQLDQWATEEGFAKVGVADLELTEASDNLRDWLARLI